MCMWIFDKLFNRKIEGKSSLDDLAENVVVNKETNTTEIGGNLNVNGIITQNGQPLGGGTKLYKHVISGILDDNANARLIIISTSNELISDRYPLMYNTELILKINYVSNINSSQRDVANVIDISFNTGAYKLILRYFSGSPTVTDLQINASGYTDTITEL